jgi:hypothetical protein
MPGSAGGDSAQSQAAGHEEGRATLSFPEQGGLALDRKAAPSGHAAERLCQQAGLSGSDDRPSADQADGLQDRSGREATRRLNPTLAILGVGAQRWSGRTGALLVVPDEADITVYLGDEGHFLDRRRIGARPWKHVADLGDPALGSDVGEFGAIGLVG